MGLLSDASTWLSDTLAECEGVAVTYRRRRQPASPLTITATRGQTEHEQDVGDGVLKAWRSADWIVKADELDDGAALFEPEPGDRVELTVGGVSQTYEVMSVAGGPCFYYQQPQQISLRIHTKRVKG